MHCLNCNQLLGGRGVKVLLSDPERRSSASVSRGDVGQKAVAKKVEYSVAPYEVRYLELTEGGQTYEYKSPVMIIPVTIKNNRFSQLRDD